MDQLTSASFNPLPYLPLKHNHNLYYFIDQFLPAFNHHFTEQRYFHPPPFHVHINFPFYASKLLTSENPLPIRGEQCNKCDPLPYNQEPVSWQHERTFELPLQSFLFEESAASRAIPVNKEYKKTYPRTE